jgi:hypothetical protein
VSKKPFQSQLVKDLAPAIVALAIAGSPQAAKGASCLYYAGQIYEGCAGNCVDNYDSTDGAVTYCLDYCDEQYTGYTQVFCHS